MDNVFEMAVGDDYETDQLLNYCVIKVDAVRAFSRENFVTLILL